MRTTREAGIRTRALIVLHAAGGKNTAHIADAVGYDPSAVLSLGGPTTSDGNRSTSRAARRGER